MRGTQPKKSNRSNFGRLNSGLAFLALAVSSMLASAQNFPTKQVTLVVPNPPGGSIDIQARLYAAKLQEMWKQNVIVEYKAGGGTLIGMDFTAKSAPDGHTICMAVTPLVILPALQPKMPYDTVKDLAGVTLTGVSSILIASSPTLPANNLAEVIALAKKSPASSLTARPALAAPCTSRVSCSKAWRAWICCTCRSRAAPRPTPS